MNLLLQNVPSVTLASHWVLLELGDDVKAHIPKLADTLGQALDRVVDQGFTLGDALSSTEVIGNSFELSHIKIPGLFRR
jgi:hypothetical protein